MAVCFTSDRSDKYKVLANIRIGFVSNNKYYCTVHDGYLNTVKIIG